MSVTGGSSIAAFAIPPIFNASVHEHRFGTQSVSFCKKRVSTGDRGAWNLNGVELYQGAELKSWGIVSFVRNTQQIGNSLQSFVEGLMAMMEKMGLSVPHNLPPLTDAGNKDATDALKDGMHDAQSAFHSAPQILLALLPDKDPWLYKEIKRAAEGEVGVMTQCFVASSAGISKPRAPIQRSPGQTSLFTRPATQRSGTVLSESGTEDQPENRRNELQDCWFLEWHVSSSRWKSKQTIHCLRSRRYAFHGRCVRSFGGSYRGKHGQVRHRPSLIHLAHQRRLFAVTWEASAHVTSFCHPVARF